MYEGYTELLVEKDDKILIVKFNNPKKKNCVNRTAYKEIARALRTVANDDTVTVVVFTGVGDFFTAGNDLSQAAEVDDIDAQLKESSNIFKEMVSSLIDCPKITIALVNGPCIGIGATMAGVCDVLWCSETAYFSAPFTQLGIVPEAASSYLFPLLVGRSKASEMLLLSEKLTAEEAYKFNFASRLYKHSEVNTVIWPKIREYSELPPESMQISKRLMRSYENDAMYKALRVECEELNKRFTSEECMNALIKFATRKNRSKL